MAFHSLPATPIAVQSQQTTLVLRSRVLHRPKLCLRQPVASLPSRATPLDVQLRKTNLVLHSQVLQRPKLCWPQLVGIHFAQATPIDGQSRQTSSMLRTRALHRPKLHLRLPVVFHSRQAISHFDQSRQTSSMLRNRSSAHAQATLAIACGSPCSTNFAAVSASAIHSSILIVLEFFNLIFPIAWMMFAASLCLDPRKPPVFDSFGQLL